MVRLKWLKIAGYRNVQPGRELHFSDGFNVLLGKNGTGKTTLLELISRILQGNCEFPDEDVDFEYRIELESMSLEARIRTFQVADPAMDVIRARLGEQPGRRLRAEHVRIRFSHEHELTYQYDEDSKVSRLSFQGGSEDISFQGNELFVHRVVTALTVYVERATPDVGLRTLWVGDCVAWLRRSAHLSRFDESLGFFNLMTSVSKLLFLQEHEDQVRIISRVFVPVGRDEASNPTLEADGIFMGTSALRSLEAFVRLADLKNASFLLYLTEKQVQNGSSILTYGKPQFRLTRADGSVLSHDLLSYGQKRLLAFLFYLDLNPDVVIADELVDAFHHEWIAACVDAIGQRQAFLASQNPLLIDYLSFDSAEAVRSTFIRCRLERDDRGREEMVWQPFSEAEASSFYESYKVGIQHVSELLIADGLW